jgi:hypothetical protein
LSEITTYNRQYYLRNKEKILKSNAEYVQNNKEKVNAWQAEYRFATKEKRVKSGKIYRATHKEEIRIRKRKYEKQKANDNLYKLKKNLSRRLRLALKKFNSNKKSPIFDIIGKPDEIIDYFSKFNIDILSPNSLTGKTIDHICPLAQAQNEEEILKLSHYSNLRIMTRRGNGKKSNKKTKLAEKMCIKLLGRKWID